jgi:DNA helicase-2/ATP-dependent DNA helicase PcrA
MKNEIYKDELRRLEAALAQIERELAETEAAINIESDNVRELSRAMWGNTPHLIRSFDDVVELSSHIQEIDVKEALRRLNLTRRRTLIAMRDSPYFGRTDLLFDGENGSFSVYIGRGAVGEGSERLVYDWRAPICSVYYEYPLGPCSYTSPNGDVQAELTLKRQYKIARGELIYAVDTDMKIDDELLLEALASPSNSRLKAIISSIQKEQYDAIRHGAARNLLVTGPAGSGKTSVGTHRLAYLLYNDTRLKSEHVVILSHNSFFEEYISDIIPELGETGVGSANFYRLCRRYIPEHFAVTDWCDLAEELLSDGGELARELEIKYSKDFSGYIERRVPSLSFKFSNIVLAGECLLTGGDIRARWKASAGGMALKARRESLSEYVRDSLRYELGNRDYKFFNKISSEYDFDKNKFIDEFCDREAKRLRDMMTLSPAALYPTLLRDFLSENGLPPDIWRRAAKRLERGVARFDDAVLMAFTALRLGELRPNPIAAHVLIDEAQDYCRLQHILLRAIFPRSVFTLLADSGQSILPQCAASGEDELAELYGAERVVLNKSYRSTLQINALASALLNRKYECMARDGAKPRVLAAGDVAGETRRLFIEKLREHNTVCVLTRSVRNATLIFEALGADTFPDPDSRAVLVSDADASPSPRAVVVPLALAKGMEFDCVIIPCLGDDFPLPSGSVGYTMVTRALHELHIVAPPEALKNAPAFISELCDVVIA